MAKVAVMLVALALVAVAATGAGGALALQCKPEQLAVCAPAIIGGSPPTEACCSNLRAQQECFCQYAHDPTYGKYVKSPNARQTLTSCNITIPNC